MIRSATPKASCGFYEWLGFVRGDDATGDTGAVLLVDGRLVLALVPGDGRGTEVAYYVEDVEARSASLTVAGVAHRRESTDVCLVGDGGVDVRLVRRKGEPGVRPCRRTDIRVRAVLRGERRGR